MTEYQENHNQGSGQSVNVVISGGSAKWLIIGLLSAFIILFATSALALYATQKAVNSERASLDKQTEYRLIQLWLQEASATCTAAGIKPPAIPAAILK